MYLKRYCFLLTILLALNTFANDEALVFQSNEDEKRYYALIKEIRCPVCQGQSIAESNAQLAKDLRLQTKTMIINGDSNKTIRQFMINRYGDFVSFSPSVNQLTVLLWILPPTILLLLLILFRRHLKKENNHVLNTEQAEKHLK